MKSDRWALMQAISVILLLIGTLYYPVFAHDHNRPELRKWFESLRAKGFNGANSGAACCDGTDATRLDDVDWDTKDGHYRVRLNGQWIDVPPESVVEGPNYAGPAMVWPYTAIGTPLGVRCFMPGTLS